MKSEEIKEVLSKHAAWLAGELGGERANLDGADLRSARLDGANLYEASFYGADFRRASLDGANLYGADFRRATLYGASLDGANCYGANFDGANLRSASLDGARLPPFQIPQGTLVGWKKVQGHIVRLCIPREAKRTAALTGRKCRASFARVEWVEGGGPVSSDGMGDGVLTVYAEGETVRPDSYDPDIREECTNGIHFFLTREEAEEWTE